MKSNSPNATFRPCPAAAAAAYGHQARRRKKHRVESWTMVPALIKLHLSLSSNFIASFLSCAVNFVSVLHLRLIEFSVLSHFAAISHLPRART